MWRQVGLHLVNQSVMGVRIQGKATQASRKSFEREPFKVQCDELKPQTARPVLRVVVKDGPAGRYDSSQSGRHHGP
jgi:hypothetical protein